MTYNKIGKYGKWSGSVWTGEGKSPDSNLRTLVYLVLNFKEEQGRAPECFRERGCVRAVYLLVSQSVRLWDLKKKQKQKQESPGSGGVCVPVTGNPRWLWLPAAGAAVRTLMSLMNFRSYLARRRR